MRCHVSAKQMQFCRTRNRFFRQSSSDASGSLKGARHRQLFYYMAPVAPEAGKKEESAISVQAGGMQKHLAEAIILQAIEDLWSPQHRGESIEFFLGEGFAKCAELAGMGIYDRLRLIRHLKKAFNKRRAASSRPAATAFI